MFDIVLSKQAELFYCESDNVLASKLNAAFDYISTQPFFGNNIKKLRGALSGLYRYRIGDYRIVYSVESKIRIISVVWIGKRKDAY
jgi:mRNA interferase RelE/StbE